MTRSEEQFIQVCKGLNMDPVLAAKVIVDGEGPHISKLDKKEYAGTDIWNTRLRALHAGASALGVGVVKKKILDL